MKNSILHTPYMHDAPCSRPAPEANFPPPPPEETKKGKNEKETPLPSWSGLVQRRPGPAFLILFFSAVRPPSSFSFFFFFFFFFLFLSSSSPSSSRRYLYNFVLHFPSHLFSSLSHFVVIPRVLSFSFQEEVLFIFVSFEDTPRAFLKRYPFYFEALLTASLSYDFLITLF